MIRQVAPAVLVLFATLALTAGCEPEEPQATLQTAEPLVRLSPRYGGQGMAMTIGLRGINTQWQQGDLRIDLGEDITVGGVTILGPNHAEAEILISPTAALGYHDVEVSFPVGVDDDRTTRTLVLTEEEGLTVEPGGIISITPDRARLGATLQIEVIGFNTGWQDGVTWADFGPGIFVNWVTIADPTTAWLSVSVDQRAEPGFHTVVLFNGPFGATADAGFFVDRSSIAIDIDPDHGNQGEILPFVVRGFGTHWSSGIDSDTGLQVETLIDLSTSICVNEGYPECQDEIEPGGVMTVLAPTNVQGLMQISNGAAPTTYDVRAYVIQREDFNENGLIEEGEYSILEEVILHDGFEVREVPIDCSDNPGVSFGFSITRDIDNDTCTVNESVSASAVFFTPLDPPCGSPPGPPVFPYDINYTQSPPSGSVDCPATPTCDAGPFVYLESELNTITLVRRENTYTGAISYVPEFPLTLEDYKFGYVPYDLVADPGSADESQIPAFRAEQVLWTLPSDFELLEPIPCQNYTHDPANDLQILWTPAQTYDVAGLSALFITSDGSVDPPQPWRVITLPWDDGDHVWESQSFAPPFPEGGGYFVFGAGVGEPKWFFDFGAGQVGVENQGRSGLSYRGFMLLRSGGEEE
jgi:hypothetical protein